MKTRSTFHGATYSGDYLRVWMDKVLVSEAGGLSSSTGWTDFVTVGDNFPDWRERIASGANATTYLEGFRRYLTHRPGRSYIMLKEKAGAERLQEIETLGPLGVFASFPSDPAGLSTVEANRQALTKFNTRTLEVNQTFNGGVFLGELGQTLRGIKRPAESLFRSIGSYRREARELRSTIVKSREHLSSLRSRERRSAISNANKAIAGLWLEKQFHWKPLLGDIDDGMKTIADMSSSPESRRTISASATGGDDPVVGTNVVLNNQVAHYASTVVSKTVSVRYKGAISIQPKDSSLPTLENLGLTMRNFVPTIWELMPYSFVADYFANIGDVINGWSSGGHNVRWCYSTIRKDSRESVSYSKLPEPIYSSFWTLLRYDYQAPSWVVGTTRVVRNVYEGNFVPSLGWKLPGLSMKWLNLGALVSARNLDRFL